MITTLILKRGSNNDIKSHATDAQRYADNVTDTIGYCTVNTSRVPTGCFTNTTRTESKKNQRSEPYPTVHHGTSPNSVTLSPTMVGRRYLCETLLLMIFIVQTRDFN